MGELYRQGMESGCVLYVMLYQLVQDLFVSRTYAKFLKIRSNELTNYNRNAISREMLWGG